MKTIHIAETTSTNDFLRDYSPQEDITIAWTDFQTHGRGQSGAWISEAGKNLLFSVLLTPDRMPASEGFILSQANAVALRDTLQEYVGEVWIKWPNDIYTDNRKIAGTLIENQLCGKTVSRSVIGTGININQSVFPDGLAAPATSIVSETGATVPPEEVLNRFAGHFVRYYTDIQEGRYYGIRDTYRQSLYLRGQEHLYADKDGIFTGVIIDVEPDGRLVVMDDKGIERRYAFKEIKLIHGDRRYHL